MEKTSENMEIVPTDTQNVSPTKKRKADDDLGIDSKKYQSNSQNLGHLDMQMVNSILKAVTEIETTPKTTAWFTWPKKKTDLGLTLVVVGETSAGKSTFIQQLLKIAGALPVDKRKCTMYPVKTCIVRPDVLHPYTYEVTYPTKEGMEDKRFATAGDVKKFFSELFTLRNGTPCYNQICTLKIADQNAVQIVLIDTPGERLGSSDWLPLTKKVGDSTSPYVIVPVKYDSADICGDHVLMGILREWKPKLKELKMLVIITHMDEFRSDDREDVGALAEQITKIKQEFHGAEINIALAHTIDPKAEMSNFDHHREMEEKTLDNLSTAITNLDGIILGLDAIRDFILRLYIKKYDGECLRGLKKGIDMQIAEKEKDIGAKGKVTKCKDERKNIEPVMSDYSDWVTVAENRCSDRLAKAVASISQDVDLTISPPPVDPKPSPYKPSTYGAHNDEQAGKRLDKARKIVESSMLALLVSVPSFVDEALDLYKEFLGHQLVNVEKTCPPLHKEIMDFWDSYVDQKKDETIKKINALTKRDSTNTRLVPKSPNSPCFTLPKDCKFAQPGPVSSIVNQCLSVLLYIWSHNFMAEINLDYFVGFSVRLSDYLSTSDKEWHGANATELSDLQKALADLKKTSATIGQVISDISKM